MLITFEGIDGCGKSSQISLLKAYLEQSGYDVQLFREPGGTKLSEHIRDILLDKNQEIHPLAEMLLFSAARAQLTAEKIRPLLADGVIVILDRFYDSTTAYQGYGRNAVPVDTIEHLNKMATQNLVPDVTFYMKITPEMAYSRRIQEGDEDRMERAGTAFFESVSDGFDQIAAREKRIITIDAKPSQDEIFKSIITHLKPLLDAK